MLVPFTPLSAATQGSTPWLGHLTRQPPSPHGPTWSHPRAQERDWLSLSSVRSP